MFDEATVSDGAKDTVRVSFHEDPHGHPLSHPLDDRREVPPVVLVERFREVREGLTDSHG